jgi:hypothetical protein
MRSWWTSALSVSAVLLVSACAARSARPERATSAATPTGEQAQQSAESTWREMTWAEYYSDVMERASRRGVTVVWVNPPPVRPAQPTAAQPIDRVTPPPAR